MIRRIALFAALACVSAPLALLAPSASGASTSGVPTIAHVNFGCDAKGINAAYANFPAGPVTAQIEWTFTQGTVITTESSSVTFTGPIGTFIADYPTVPVGPFTATAAITADGQTWTFQTSTALTCIPTPITPTTTPTTTPTITPASAPITAPATVTTPTPTPTPIKAPTLPPRPAPEHHHRTHHSRLSCSKLAGKSHARIGPQALTQGVATLVAGAPAQITSITVTVDGAGGHVWRTDARGDQLRLPLLVSSQTIFGVDPHCGCTYGPGDHVAVTFHSSHSVCPAHTVTLPYNNQDPPLTRHHAATLRAAPGASYTSGGALSSARRSARSAPAGP